MENTIAFTDEYLDKVVLSKGSHSTPEQGMCAVEWMAYVRNEPFSDAPLCMDRKPTLRTMSIALNDAMPHEVRNSLAFKRAIAAALTAEASPELETRRAFRAADWAIREGTPIALEAAAVALAAADQKTHSSELRDHAAKLRAHAAKLRELAPVTDQTASYAAGCAARAASNAASYAAGCAARAARAASNAASYAASYAASNAASYAASNAASNAARAASNAASYAASYAAGYAASYAASYAAGCAARCASPWDGAIALLAELAAMRTEQPSV